MVKKTLECRRAYHANDITSQAGEFVLPYIYTQSLYQRHVMCFDTLHPMFVFYFFRRCKDKEISRNYQTFSKKNSFLREYFYKNLVYINISLYFCSEILTINSK